MTQMKNYLTLMKIIKGLDFFDLRKSINLHLSEKKLKKNQNTKIKKNLKN
jgi:hypothetical protein